jgi:hypothetical protein
MSSTDLISVFGLLEPRPLKNYNQESQRSYTLDSFLVECHGGTSHLTCKCLRSKPYVLATEDLSRCHPPGGIYACSLCLSELRDARTPSDRIRVWLTQNRPSIANDQHLHLPKTFTRLVDTEDKVIMRPRRFVYAKFYDIALQQRDKVLCTCGDTLCVNPYHMMLAASPATKVTPEMKEDVQLWLSKNIKCSLIRQMLEVKYKRSLSLRTITNLKKSLLV